MTMILAEGLARLARRMDFRASASDLDVTAQVLTTRVSHCPDHTSTGDALSRSKEIIRAVSAWFARHPIVRKPTLMVGLSFKGLSLTGAVRPSFVCCLYASR